MAALLHKLEKEKHLVLGQLLLGSVISVVSIMIGAIMWGILNEVVGRMDLWLRRPKYRFITFVVVLLMVLFCIMTVTSIGVWLWALVFVQMSVFTTWEEAVYYSLVAYTTLGIGDVVVPQNQRLLGGMTGANGFFMFGLMTAMLTDIFRHVGRVQHGMRD
ncbi:ion channel [Ruegeria sp. HKCCE4150]|uniref:ion channel n=1 Tax=Ruegeria sp. HKCCE4150 TaxID=2794828 RepID=UPI001AE8EC8C|nr:ion channel [Ruegeria sp. HKCCE4150]